MNPNGYPRYRGVPELAGVCTMTEAQQPGLSVDACVARLKRYHYTFQRLHRILTARLTAEPIYELKTAYSHHAYLCAEHVAALRKRVGEMREPPLGLDQVPDENLALYFDEILGAPSSEALADGIYSQALPALREAIAAHLEATNKLVDAPTVRLCRFALLELDEMIQFGQLAVAGLLPDGRNEELADWARLLHDALAAAGGLAGADEPDPWPLARRYSRQPYRYDPLPRRDERFIDPHNAGVNCEAFLYDESMPTDAKTVMMFYKRIRELDVPEMMAGILVETPDQPWDYYLDLSRQLWDEARHAMMGEVGLHSLGIDWRTIPITINFSYNLNTQCTALERHGVLYFIEQGLMPRSGKRYEWEVAVASGDDLAALFQDYDWADEVLHAGIGREWYVTQFKDRDEAVDYGDQAWSKVLSRWRELREQGLTHHENWWPRVYAAACGHWGKSPEPQVMAFHETYEEVRADLKGISGSG